MNEDKYSKKVNEKVQDVGIAPSNLDRHLLKVITTYYLSEKSLFTVSSPEMDKAKCVFRLKGIRRDGKNWFVLSELTEEELLKLLDLKIFW